MVANPPSGRWKSTANRGRVALSRGPLVFCAEGVDNDGLVQRLFLDPDDSIRRWTSWPQRGREQWCEIDLGKVKTIRSVGVCFYDDGDGVQVPSGWHLEAERGGRWEKVVIYNTDSYSTLPDNYNTVHPEEVLSSRKLRIVMAPGNAQACVGILSVDVDSAE